MRGAVPPQQRSSSLLAHAVRARVGFGALIFACSCSVYSSDLIGNGAAGASQGGSDTQGGRGGGSGSGAVDGGSAGSAHPGDGGEGDSPSVGGNPGVGGGSGSTAGGSDVSGSGGSMSPGGSTGAAGSAGSGGTGTVASLIDGFEDNDITLEPTNGRSGVWYLFHDATTGKVGPSPLTCSPLTDAPAALGTTALHITASGFTDYGSGLGVDFRAGKKLYDASAYSGIRFWARVGEGKNTHHRVQIPDVNTDKAGGKCNSAADAPDGAKCDDHFGIAETFTTTWAQYTIKFDALTQGGWGYPGDPDVKLTKASVYGIQITAKAKLEVDLWLDEVEFF